MPSQVGDSMTACESRRSARCGHGLGADLGRASKLAVNFGRQTVLSGRPFRPTCSTPLVRVTLVFWHRPRATFAPAGPNLRFDGDAWKDKKGRLTAAEDILIDA